MNYHPGNIMLHCAIGILLSMFSYAAFGASLLSGILTIIVVAIALTALNEVFPTFWRDE